MSSVERIHPELNPEDIPGNRASSEDSKTAPEGDNIVLIEKARRIFRKNEKFSTEEQRNKEKLKKRFELYDSLVKEYSCGIDAKPRWCVWGKNSAGDQGVLFWIKPVSQDEDVAHTLAKLMNEFKGQVRAEKTEWNETLSGKPVYFDQRGAK